VNRNELKQLASDRIEDSRILLENRRWSAGYYLIGYAVEIALKACMLKFVEETGVIFADKRFAEKCWTHKFDDLLKQANLEPQYRKERDANAAFASFWSIASLWTESCRYDQKSEADARALYDAITNDSDGVFKWITHHW